MIRDWCLIQKPEDAAKLEAWALKLDKVRARPPRLMWNQPRRQEAPSLLSSAGDPEPAHRVSNNVVSNAHVSGSDVESELIEVHASEPARDAVQNLNVAFTCRK
jgi:hypothetical protein